MTSRRAMKAKVSTKGWVVIPAALRKRFGLKPGSLVEFEESDERILIAPVNRDVVEDLFGKLAGPVSLRDALIEERAKELKREEARVCVG